MNEYTITVEDNPGWAHFWTQPSNSTISQGIQAQLGSMVQIESVNRAWWSGYIAITFLSNYGADALKAAFMDAFQAIGYPNASLIDFTGGSTSNAPVTISGVLDAAASGAGSAAAAAIKPLAFYLLAGLAVYFIIKEKA